jgi:RNA polymerase sigma factor (sigma-70 family)
MNDVNELFEKNKKLVFFSARRIKSLYNLRRNDLEFDDIIQVGYIGLWKACKGFKPELNLKFSTYAVKVIIGEILNENRGKIFGFRIPRESKTISKIIAKRLDEGENWPSIKEVQDEFNCSKDHARIAIEILKLKMESIYKPINDNGLILQDAIKDEFCFEKKLLLNEDLNERFSILSSTEKRILKYYFANEYSQMEISKLVGLSQPHVSRIYKKALEKMRNYEVEDYENEPKFA